MRYGLLVLPFLLLSIALFLALKTQQSDFQRDIRGATGETNTLVRNQLVATCRSNNDFRREVNARGRVQVAFLQDAGLSRLEAAAAFAQDGNTAQEAINRTRGARWVRWAGEYTRIPLRDCQRAFPRP